MRRPSQMAREGYRRRVSVIRVGPTRTKVTSGGNHRTVAPIRYADRTERLWIATGPDIPFLEHDLGDVWLPAVLALAMRRGEDLVLRDPISDQRREAVDMVQDIFASWYPTKMTRVTITAPPSNAPKRKWLRARRREDRLEATCFTGGVDSFYSLLTNPDVGAIVYGLGLDIPLSRHKASHRVDADLRQIAHESRVEYLWARTNLREVFGTRVSWGSMSHGAVLASLGLVLSPKIASLRIPASHTFDADFAWGSHPALDPLWSTDRLKVIHDGADTPRSEKTRRLADETLAQQHLRVCFLQFRQNNCSRCLKCMRTMATLSLLERLDDFPTFTEPLDLDRLQEHAITKRNEAFMMHDVLNLGAGVPGHEDLKAVIESMVTTYDDTFA